MPPLERGSSVADKATFTPGPWAWETPMGEHCPWIVKAGQQAYEWEPIATLGDCTEDGPSPRSKAFREVQANARLMATSPEMLEALYQYESDLLYPPTGDSRERRLERVRKVIAKALGEAR